MRTFENGRGQHPQQTVGQSDASPSMDSFAAPNRAYGLRQLLSSYSGNIISITDANGAVEHVLTPSADRWVTVAEIEALAGGFSGGNAYLHTWYDQSGNAANATTLAENSGGKPPMLASGGVAYSLILNGITRPCVFHRGLSACKADMAGGSYQLHPSRFFLHAVVAQNTGDSSDTSVFPAAGVLMGQNWDGTPTIANNAQFLGYGGGTAGTAALNYAAMDDVGVAYRNLAAAWSLDAVHIVSTRRDSNTTLQAFKEGSLQETLTISNTTSAASACSLFNLHGTQIVSDAYRCTEIVHWQSDPGAIQASIYSSTVTAWTGTPIDNAASHQWCLDGTSATAGAEDSADRRTDLFNVVANPAVVTDTDIGFAGRRFNGTTQWLYGPSDGDGGIHREQLSIIASFRIPLQALTTGTVLAFSKPDGSNIIIKAILNSSKQMTFKWTDNTAATAVANSVTVLPQGRWIRFAITRADGNTIKFHVFGGLAETITQVNGNGTLCANDGTERWTLGANGALANPSAFDISTITTFPYALTDMEIEDQFRRMALLDVDTYKPTKVEISDSTGAMIDVSTGLPGGNWLKSFGWGDSNDDNMMKATVKLFRSIGTYSLSRYSNNPANRYPLPSSTAPGVDETTYTSPGTAVSTTEFLAYGRRVIGYSCRLPLGIAPTTNDYKKVFYGCIDHVAWGDPAEAVVNCLDDGMFLLKANIMNDILYGSDTAGVSIQSVINSLLTDGADTGKNPRWGIADGPVGGLPFNPDGAVPALKLGWTDGSAQPPSDPSWNLKLYRQARDPMLTALNTLAEQDALVCRYRYQPPLGGFYLTLYEPPLIPRWIDMVLTSRELMKLSDISLASERIRTTVSVIFNSSSNTSPTVPTIETGTTTKQVGAITVWSDGTKDAKLKELNTDGYFPCRLTVSTHDLDVTERGYSGVDDYGYIPCESIEPAAGNINTIVEAQRFAVSILRALCFPQADISGSFDGMPEMEIHDRYRLRADATTGNGTQNIDCSVVSFNAASNEPNTVTMRGTPSGGTERHLVKVAGPGTGNPATIDIKAAAGGLPKRMVAGAIYAAVANGQIGHGNLRTMLQNGDFALKTFGDGDPPDAWTMNGGAWSTDVELDHTTVESGFNALKFKNNTGFLDANHTPTNPFTTIQIEARVRVDAGSINARVLIEWFDSSLASLGVDTVMTYTPGATGTWYTARATIAARANSAFFALRLSRNGAGAGNCFYDRVQACPLKASFSVTGASGSPGNKVVSLVDFATVTYDHGGNYDNSGGNYKFTCPEDGFYEFCAYVHQQAAAGLHATQVAIYKNGALWVASGIGWQGKDLGGGTHGRGTIRHMDYHLAGDYFQTTVYADNTGGGAGVIQSDSFFTGRLVSVE